MKEKIKELEDEIASLREIIVLQDRLVNQLIEATNHMIDCDGLPCVSLIEDSLKLRAEIKEQRGKDV